MRILIANMLMQRYRAILHILDLLTSLKHEVIIQKRGEAKYKPQDHFKNPWDISCCSPGSLAYLANNFGIKVSLDNVTWIEKNEYNSALKQADVVIQTDYMHLADERYINIPHNDFKCKTLVHGKDIVVGNGMCVDIRNRQEIVKEKQNTVLVIHPGGGRTILSPLREQVPQVFMIENQMQLFNNVLDQIPSVFSVVVKTHPAPYIGCDIESIVKYVIPRLNVSRFKSFTVVADNLIDEICKAEYILTCGSSTTLWIMGSRKKWMNIIDCAKYNLDSPKRRDIHARADNWLHWPQNVCMSDLHVYFEDYNKWVPDFFYNGTLFQKYNTIANMSANWNVVNIIRSTFDRINTK